MCGKFIDISKDLFVPSRELACPLPRHFWRWFSCSPVGIWTGSLEGNCCIVLQHKHFNIYWAPWPTGWELSTELFNSTLTSWFILREEALRFEQSRCKELKKRQWALANSCWDSNNVFNTLCITFTRFWSKVSCNNVSLFTNLWIIYISPKINALQSTQHGRESASRKRLIAPAVPNQVPQIFLKETNLATNIWLVFGFFLQEIMAGQPIPPHVPRTPHKK